MFRRGPVLYSPCELDFLIANRETRSINELSLYLGKSRASITNKIKELDGKAPPKKKNKISRIGKRDDILKNGKPQYVRSGWEADVLRWLNHEGIEWEYEPKVFVFKDVKHGTVSYCPDIFLPQSKEWLEIKGMLDAQSQTALRRFKKYYPQEAKKLKAIVGRPNTKADKFFKKHEIEVIKYMNELTKEFKDKIPHWES